MRSIVVKTAPRNAATGGRAPIPAENESEVRLLAATLLLGALYGCSGGGWLPNGPHTLDQALLHRIVLADARDSGLSPRLVDAMIDVESHGDPAAVSRAGAQGLMQLMPDTASTYGVLNPFDPDENVSGGCRYMRDLLHRYHNNVSLALAAYNAGPGAVDGARGVPSFPETRAYVARIVAELRTQTN